MNPDQLKQHLHKGGVIARQVERDDPTSIQFLDHDGSRYRVGGYANIATKPEVALALVEQHPHLWYAIEEGTLNTELLAAAMKGIGERQG